jgi:A/G-specific adenine glycosylase
MPRTSTKTSSAKHTHTAASQTGPTGKDASAGTAAALGLSVLDLRRDLASWFRASARVLPWRGVEDPYAIWVSEIMLQQTRVATVMERYVEFLARFPTLAALAAAEVEDVLALWSGLGYYRRARMLHRAAQFVAREMNGQLPRTAATLRVLPGVGEYTAAAIASIAFGESVAVVDGNVERVLLRVMGEAEGTAAHRRMAQLAQELVPPAARKGSVANPPGEHNQAMMELGALVCLPQSPLCLQCPIVEHCRTRGEHITAPRTAMRSQYTAHLLAARKSGVLTEVLLAQRPADARLMPDMLELPSLPSSAVEGLEPALRLRHAITTTNYLVEVFTEGAGRSLLDALDPSVLSLRWVSTEMLAQQPLTGLARKVLLKLKLMER